MIKGCRGTIGGYFMVAMGCCHLKAFSVNQMGCFGTTLRCCHNLTLLDGAT
jgi:hypothetical protein